MPSDLPSVLPPSATLDKTLYGDLIVALEYDRAIPPHAPFEYVVDDDTDNSGPGSTNPTTSTATLKDYAVRAILREFVGAVEKKDLLAAWIEAITSCPRARWDEIMQEMRKVYPRCANRLAGRDPSKKELEDNAIELGNWLVAETPPYKPTRREFCPHVEFVETIYLNDLLEYDKKRLKKIIDEIEGWSADFLLIISSAFVIRYPTGFPLSNLVEKPSEPVIVPGQGRLAESNRNAIYEMFYNLAVALLMNFEYVEIGSYDDHLPENEIWLWVESPETSRAAIWATEEWTRTTLEMSIQARGLQEGFEVMKQRMKEMLRRAHDGT